LNLEQFDTKRVHHPKNSVTRYHPFCDTLPKLVTLHKQQFYKMLLKSFQLWKDCILWSFEQFWGVTQSKKKKEVRRACYFLFWAMHQDENYCSFLMTYFFTSKFCFKDWTCNSELLKIIFKFCSSLSSFHLCTIVNLIFQQKGHVMKVSCLCYKK